MDYQLDYMEHLFSNIKHKRTESYVIHRIWNKLDDARILFKVQQEVRLPNGKYALADLFLPQLNIVVEVNEPFHEGQQEEIGRFSRKQNSTKETYDNSTQQSLHSGITPTRDAEQASQQANAAQILSQGKKEIDKMWRESGIDTIRPITAKSEAFYYFVDKSNEYTTISYPQSFGKSIDESQKSSIIYELSAYTTEKYVKPTLAKIQSSK